MAGKMGDPSLVIATCAADRFAAGQYPGCRTRAPGTKSLMNWSPSVKVFVLQDSTSQCKLNRIENRIELNWTENSFSVNFSRKFSNQS